MAEKPLQVFAIHDFEREHEDEITFYAGESIIVIEKDEKYLDGWWQGRNQRGEIGLFPMNYTSPTKPIRTETIDSTLDQQKSQIHQDDNNITTDSSITSASTINSSPPETFIHQKDQIDTSTQSLDQTPELWDVPRVCTWLESVGLENAIDNFVEQEITGDVLLDLNMETLKELGITAYGRRYKIMTAISKLISSTQPSTITNDTNQGCTMSSSTGGEPYHSSSRPANSTGSTISSPIDADSLYQFPRKAPAPPSSSTSSSNSHLHSNNNNILSRPESSTSLSSSTNNNSNNITRSNTYNTTSSSSGTVKSSDYSTRSGYRLQRDSFKDAAHPSVSHSTPIKSNNMAARINHPADQTLSMASVGSSVQRPSTDEFQAPEHEGWLHKQSDKYKTWNKRWFVLKGTNLFYFKSPKDVRMKGIINLRGYRIIVDETIHSNKYCFKAQHEQERIFYFYTDTKESMKLWLQALMKATIMRDFTSPVMSSNQVATVPLDVAQRMRPRPPSVIMYKPPPASNEPMQMVQEEEEESHHGKESSFNAPLDDNSDYRIAPSSAMNTPAISNNNTNTDDDDDEDNIDPYETAQRHQQLTLDSTDVTNGHAESTKINRSWTNAQYVDWINSYLPQGKKVVDLPSAFRNGDTLIVLLETLSGKTVRRNPDQKGGSVSMKVLDNIVAAFKFMGREGVVVDGRYTIKDIFGGHEDKILDMVDAIKMWAETNGYMEQEQNTTSNHHTTALPPTDIDTTSNSLSMNLLPEPTTTDQDDFSKSFYNDTFHHMTDSTQQLPQHVA
ncbi:uncharacterized protein BX664DRAFT_271602 [Halteromyces radiatus]|uniref:uncharacterized protein n=1 Tax=Halteromyces radiatus TaxID=101107 RepID=UPI002220E93B|nr:uncharacterized protein BX664DRAFT_271602 [Halteromyces radiatus]KAI8098777.1 hypothetical protein BX664DRAFT_271602 [Halteromyces radiatus]